MKKIILLIYTILGFVFTLYAQADSENSDCNKYLKSPFVSDGQKYQSLISPGETAEFRLTFYGGTTYRIVGCDGTGSNRTLLFTVYDIEKNSLFSNKDYNNTQYWDFEFQSTIDCIIEAKFDSEEKSGLAVILIGFKP